MLKAIKVQLYPNNTQIAYISGLLGCYRKVYNLCLDRKKTAYLNDKSNLSLKDLGAYFHQDLTKSEEFVYLNFHNTKVLKQAIMNMLEAYKNFFVNGSGFPKFKSRHDNRQSCRFPAEAVSKRNDYQSGHLGLTKELKGLAFRCSERDKAYLNKYRESVRSATLSKTKSGKYFLSILVEGELQKQLPAPKNDVVGIDLGIKVFVVTSRGQTFANLKTTRTNQKKLSRLQKLVSRKIKGSTNRDKARVTLVRFHEKLTNRKQNYLHQVANQLLDENQVIAMEDLNVKGMLKNHNLARTIQELSLTDFKTKLLYKADWYGRWVVEVNRWFPSSKLCSGCGNRKETLALSEREYHCHSCGMVADRDANAAENIEAEGRRLLATAPPGA